MELTEKLIEAIELQTKAINYLANVIGYKADDENPKGKDGKQAVSLDAEVATEISDLDNAEPVTFDHIKTAINLYAKKAGKEEALALVEKYAGSKNLKDIKPEDYHSFFVDSEV